MRSTPLKLITILLIILPSSVMLADDGVSNEAMTNAVIGFSVALQLLAIGAIWYFIKFIYKKFFN